MAALHTPPSANLPATVEHRTEELQKGCAAVGLAVLTFHSALAAYLFWGDLKLVASVGVTYLLLVLLFARRFGYWEPGTDGASWRLEVLILFLSLLAALLLLASMLAPTAPPSKSALLVAAAAGPRSGSEAAAPVLFTDVAGLSIRART